MYIYIIYIYVYIYIFICIYIFIYLFKLIMSKFTYQLVSSFDPLPSLTLSYRITSTWPVSLIPSKIYVFELINKCQKKVNYYKNSKLPIYIFPFTAYG